MNLKLELGVFMRNCIFVTLEIILLSLVYLLSFIPEECEWGGVLGTILTEFLISGLYFCLVFGQKLRCKKKDIGRIVKNILMNN